VKSEGSDHILLFGGSFEDNSLNSVYALEFDEDANFKWSLIHIGGERVLIDSNLAYLKKQSQSRHI
jgi:hypothetical protein